jgi:hypothetical protein
MECLHGKATSCNLLEGIYSYFKVEYERERLLGIANKLIHLLAIPSNLSRSYSTVSALLGGQP